MSPRIPLASVSSAVRSTQTAKRAITTFPRRSQSHSSSEPSSSRIPLPSTPSASSSRSSSATKATRDDAVVPPLSRPLGVPRPPSSVPKTWAEKKEELLNEDRHKAKRRALIKEASQGYFNDYNKARSASGGKLWMAPPVLIREDRALYFPDISGKSLSGDTTHTTDLLKGKVTLVSILSTRISDEHILSFTSPLLPDWPQSQSHDNLFQHVQINHQANPLKSMLLSFFISSLKRTVPEEGWSKYIISGGEWSHYDIEGPLGLDNKLVGYVFLVDQNVKVRWAGCGPATDEEVDNLRKATAVLMRRASGQ